MADNIEVRLLEHSKSIWRSIFTVVKDSLVYMDNSVAEILHWSGQTLDLIDSGAKNVQSIDCGVLQNGGKDDKKAIFITSSLLQGKIVEKLQNIIQCSYFQHCSIFCTISDADHAMALKKEHNMENGNFFNKFKETVEFWMNNMYATAEIHHIPFIYANIVPGLFIMPSFSSFFPILPSDVSRIQDWLRTKGEQRIFTSLSDVETHHMPQIFQVKLKLLASALCDFFEALDLTENCYGIGHTAKMLAAEVSNLSIAKMKKPVCGHCSVIFVDRTLDLVQSSSHSSSNLADKILEMLPRLPGHTVDVMVDMSSICGVGKIKPNIIVPGSLARDPSNKQTQSILNSMFIKKPQDSLSEIRRQLLEVLKAESLFPAKGIDTGNVTAETLLSFMEYFRNNLDATLKHAGLLQLAMAAIHSLQHENNTHHQQLHSTEKVLQLNLNENDSPSCLSHILTSLKNVSRSYYFEDILLLILFVYSLVGDKSLDSLEEESQLKKAIVNHVLSGRLKVKTKLIIDYETDGEDVIRSKIAKCFERLSGLQNIRENLTFFKDVFTLSSPMDNVRAYEPILKQIVDKVFDPKKPEISDIEFKSTRLKDYIKSGFSLFMNVRKPHPSDHPLLFVFVVGGVTSNEVQYINEVITTQNIKTKVIIGSTKIINSKDMLTSFFCQDNAFLNIF